MTQAMTQVTSQATTDSADLAAPRPAPRTPVLPWMLAALAAGGLFALWGQQRTAFEQQAQALQQVTQRQESALLGQTAYTRYLHAGQQALSGQASLLAATVRRHESMTEVIERQWLPGLSSSGTVAIWYTAEYAFGYDLRPGQFALRHTPAGIELRVSRPKLVATPAVSGLRHQVLSGGWLTDEKAALLKLQAQAAATALQQGQRMEADAAIVALCEKQITAFVRHFLLQQPGVSTVPAIFVVYPEAS